MNRTELIDIAKATNGRIISGSENHAVTGVVHDSRECGPGDIFVCVIGENLDGHSFIPQVVEAGCRALLISDRTVFDDMCSGGNADGPGAREDLNVILVDNTVKAMGDLAEWYLETLGLTTVAVTGSVGKTSTRDMIYYVLNEKFKCGRNLKNYNNEIGLPLSIFKLDDSYEAVVLEMGMSDFGEISRLSRIAGPDIGVITNIGTSHMEHLGSREGIFRAKMEITENLKPADEGGTMVVAFDEEFLNRERVRGDYEVIFAGQDGRSDYIVGDIDDEGIDGVSFSLEHREERRRFTVPVPGRHNATNATLAIAIGDLLGLTTEEIRRGLAKTSLTGHRLRVVRSADITVIDDTYNASPDSMKSGLKVLERSRCTGRRIAILGEMYELGEDEARMHRDVGIFAAGCDIDMVIGIGTLAENITEGSRTGGKTVEWFETKEDFIRKKDDYIKPGDLILVKASRGMKLEEVVEGLTDR